MKTYVASVKVILELPDDTNWSQAIYAVSQCFNDRSVVDWGFALSGQARAFPSEVTLPPDYLSMRQEILETDMADMTEKQEKEWSTLVQEYEALFDGLGQPAPVN